MTRYLAVYNREEVNRALVPLEAGARSDHRGDLLTTDTKNASGQPPELVNTPRENRTPIGGFVPTSARTAGPENYGASGILQSHVQPKGARRLANWTRESQRLYLKLEHTRDKINTATTFCRTSDSIFISQQIQYYIKRIYLFFF